MTRRVKRKPAPMTHFVPCVSQDHLNFWISFLRSEGAEPEVGAVDRLLEDRPDLDREAVIGVGQDVQMTFAEGVPRWKERRGLSGEDVRVVVQAYRRQHLAHLVSL